MDKKKIDILDRLQATESLVQLHLKSGEVLLGRADCIVYEEDEEGYDTIKQIRFEPLGSEFAKYFTIEEIISFTEVYEKKGANGNGQENDRDVKSGCRE